MSLLVLQPSAIAKATEARDILPGCPSVSSNPLSKCYGLGELAQNSNTELKVTIKNSENTRENIIVKDQEIDVKEGESVEFNVCLKSAPSSEVRVTVSSNDNSIILSSENSENIDSSDSNNNLLTLTFTPENWNKHQTIKAAAKSRVYEKDEKVNIKLSADRIGYNNSHEETIVLKIIKRSLMIEYSASQLNLLGKITKGKSLSFSLKLENNSQNEEEVIIDILSDKDKLKITIDDEEYISDKILKLSSEDKIIEIMLNNDLMDNDPVEFLISLSSSDVQDKAMLVVTLDSADLNSKLIESTLRKEFQLILRKEFQLTDFLESSLHSDKKSVFIKPELSVEEGKSSFLRIRLKNQPESENKADIADIIVFDRNQIASTNFLKFNSNNWNKIELNFREDRKNKNNRQTDITLIDFGENYDDYLDLMSVTVSNNYLLDYLPDDLPSVPVILALAGVSVLGLKSISSILKLTDNVSDKLNNVFELTSQARQFLKEREDQKNLGEKIDEINTRLESIENKIDNQS